MKGTQKANLVSFIILATKDPQAYRDKKASHLSLLYTRSLILTIISMSMYRSKGVTCEST